MGGIVIKNDIFFPNAPNALRDKKLCNISILIKTAHMHNHNHRVKVAETGVRSAQWHTFATKPTTHCL